MAFLQRSKTTWTKKVARCFTLLEVLIGMGLAMILLSTLTYFYQQVEWMNTEAERTQKENFQLRYAENRLSRIFPTTLSERTEKKHFYFFTSNAEGMLKTPSLVFTFNNGLKLCASFASEVLGRLYLDEQKKQLCLALWPSPKRWENGMPPMTKEVLLDNVESLAFNFYVAPKRDRSKVETKKTLVSNQKQEDTGRPPEEQQPGQRQGGRRGQDALPAASPSKSTDESAQEMLDTDEESACELTGPQWPSEWLYDYHHLPALIRVTVTRKVQDGVRTIVFAFPLSKSQKVIVYEENT